MPKEIDSKLIGYDPIEHKR